MIQETSKISYREILESGVADTNEAKVLEAIRHFTELGEAVTDREIARAMGFSDPNKVRPRRFELVGKGLVVEGGKKVCSVSGKLAITWKASLDEPLFREEGDYLVQTRMVSVETFKVLLVEMRGRGFMYAGGLRWVKR